MFPFKFKIIVKLLTGYFSKMPNVHVSLHNRTSFPDDETETLKNLAFLFLIFTNSTCETTFLDYSKMSSPSTISNEHVIRTRSALHYC